MNFNLLYAELRVPVPHMSSPTDSLVKLLVTRLALKSFSISMNPRMLQQIPSSRESFIAMSAFKRLLACMGGNMLIEASFIVKTFGTMLADIFATFRVC